MSTNIIMAIALILWVALSAVLFMADKKISQMEKQADES